MKKKDISVTKTIGGCIGEIQRWTAAQKKNRLEVRGPLVPYPTPEPAAFAPSKTALVPFLSPFRLLLCFVPIESKAKQKWFVCLLYLLDEREHTFFRFRVYGLDSVSVTPSFWLCRDALVTGERFKRRPSRVSGCFLDWSSLSSPYQTEEVTIKELALLKYQKRCAPQVGSSVSFRMKVAMKPLLLTLFDSKGEQPPN